MDALKRFYFYNKILFRILKNDQENYIKNILIILLVLFPIRYIKSISSEFEPKQSSLSRDFSHI